MSTFLKYDKVKDSTTGKMLPEIVEELKAGSGVPGDFGTLSDKVYSDKVVVPPKGYKNTPFIVMRFSSYFFITHLSVVDSKLKGVYVSGSSLDFSNETLPSSESLIGGVTSGSNPICSDAYGVQLLIDNGFNANNIEVLPPKTIADFGIVPPPTYKKGPFLVCGRGFTTSMYFIENPVIDGLGNVTSDTMCSTAVGLDFTNSQAGTETITIDTAKTMYTNSVDICTSIYAFAKANLTFIVSEPTVYVQQILGGTTEALNKYVGADRQLAVNIDDYTLRVFDGKTPGGHLISGSGSAEIPQEVLDRIASLEAMDLTNKAAITKNTEDIEAANTILTDVTFKEV